MSMSALWPEALAVLAPLDGRLQAAARARLESKQMTVTPVVHPQGHVVLVGHRSAGKTAMGPHLAAALGRPFVDLDEDLERRVGVPLAQFFARDQAAFRALERELFSAPMVPSVISAGGGFLFHHGDLLVAPHLAVLVPITAQTYRERNRDDRKRPRLMPSLGLEEELDVVYARRAQTYQAPPLTDVVDLLIWLGSRA
jgi:shikimate kinase